MVRLFTARNPLKCDVVFFINFNHFDEASFDIFRDIDQCLSEGFTVGIATTFEKVTLKTARIRQLEKKLIERKLTFFGQNDSVICKLVMAYNTTESEALGVQGSYRADNAIIVTKASEKVSALNRWKEFSQLSVLGDYLLFLTTLDTEVLDSFAESETFFNWHKLRDITWPLEKTLPKLSPKTKLRIGLSDSFASKKITNPNDQLPQMFGKVPVQYEGQFKEPRTLVGTALDSCSLLTLPYVAPDLDTFFKKIDLFVLHQDDLESWEKLVRLSIKHQTRILVPSKLRSVLGGLSDYYDAKNPLSRAIQALEQEPLTRGIDTSFWDNSLSISEISTLDTTILGLINDGTAGQVETRTPNSPKEKVVCFVTSNGAGMGHLTRLLAVARKLPSHFKSHFVSMSQACGVVGSYGMGYEYIPSKGDLGIPGPEWNEFFNTKFIEALDRVKPDVVVFDGTWPYQGIARAVLTYNSKFIWMRRGMWREGTTDKALKNNTSFDRVISPGDVAAPLDSGPTRFAKDASSVDPIIVLDESEIYSKQTARAELGIDDSENCMLITLGAGNINSIDEDVKRIIEHMKSFGNQWKIFMTSPLIAGTSNEYESVRTLSIYPLAKYAKAFDFVVSATGYNSYHEWIAYGVPALWIPNRNTITDDQVGRAVYAAQEGFGVTADNDSALSLENALDLLIDRSTRDRLRVELGSRAFTNGAVQAAEIIVEISERNSK